MADGGDKGPKNRDDDCEMVTSLQSPALSKLEMYLHEAARRNQVDLLSKILGKRNLNLDCRNQLDRTALHMAVSHGNRGAVELLVRAKATVEVTDKYGMTPLLWAAYFGHIEIVEFLFVSKASLARKNKQGMNVLHIAAETNNMELYEYVFSKKKNFKVDEPEAAFMKGEIRKIEKMFEEPDKNGMTPLLIASAHGSLHIVEKLLEKNVRADMEDNSHMTALHHAVKGGHVEVMKRLLECTPLSKKKDHKDDSGRAALHYACELGHVGAVKSLLAAQVSIDLESNPCELEAEPDPKPGSKPGAKAMPKPGPKVDPRNAGVVVEKREMHAIHLAAQNGHCEVIRLLVKSGCLINAQNSHGNTGLHVAALSDQMEACKVLIECGIEIDMPNSRLQTALHAAVEQNKPDTVEILLLAGSNTALTDKTGKTPLLLATRGSYISLVDMIIKSERFHERKRQMASANARQTAFKPASDQAYSNAPPSDEEDLDGDDEELDRAALAEADQIDGGTYSGSLSRSGLHNGSLAKNGSLARSRGSSAPGTHRTNVASGLAPSHASRAPSVAGSRVSRPASAAGSRISRADSVATGPMSVYGEPEDHSDIGVSSAAHLPEPEADMPLPDAFLGAFRPVDYRNTYNIHVEEARGHLDDENYRLKEFNQVYAEEFKLFLWRLAFKHLRNGEWKKLAHYWNFRNEHIAAIEHQYTGSLSYKQHGYRLLCIWFHGVDRNETPVRQLYEALVAIGRKQLADRMRLSLDAGLSKSGNGKCAVS